MGYQNRKEKNMEENKSIINVETVRVDNVICICCVIGNGTEKSPYVKVKQYWTLDGESIGQLKV